MWLSRCLRTACSSQCLRPGTGSIESGRVMPSASYPHARAYRIAATCLPLNLMLIPHRALKQSGPAARCNTRDRP